MSKGIKRMTLHGCAGGGPAHEGGTHMIEPTQPAIGATPRRTFIRRIAGVLSAGVAALVAGSVAGSAGAAG